MPTNPANASSFPGFRFAALALPNLVAMAFQNTRAVHPDSASQTLGQGDVILEKRVSLPANAAAIQLDCKLSHDHSGHGLFRLST